MQNLDQEMCQLLVNVICAEAKQHKNNQLKTPPGPPIHICVHETHYAGLQIWSQNEKNK